MGLEPIAAAWKAANLPLIDPRFSLILPFHFLGSIYNVKVYTA